MFGVAVSSTVKNELLPMLKDEPGEKASLSPSCAQEGGPLLCQTQARKGLKLYTYADIRKSRYSPETSSVSFTPGRR